MVIGSAATRLCGAMLPVADLDILTSARDALALAEQWRDRRLPQDDAPGGGRFRSHFARFAFPGVPVEVMGELEVDNGSGWQRVIIDEVTHVHVDGLEIAVPSLAEQIRLLHLFGRDKDLQRAAWLAAGGKPA